MRINHEIFQKPHEVELTITDRPTPKAYAGKTDAGTMPMWRVQTEGYEDGNGQLIGLVSSDAGFLDSPDVEWISSGVNSKNPKAVALSRHGNFFHWGFAVSPTYLTEEAKLVFVNAVHYISKFDGQTPIARKRKGTRVRSSVRTLLQGISDEGWAARMKRHEEFVAETERRKTEIRKKIDAGEEVSDWDKRMLDMPPSKPRSRFQYVKRFFSDEEWAAVDGDVDAVTARIEADLPYMRSKGWYEMEVDQDLKALGIANDDIRLLETAIAELSKPDHAERARRVLARYTDQKHSTAREWSQWLIRNRSRLFFTESGGYRWLVDDRGADSAPAIEAAAPANAPLETTERKPVASALEVTRTSDGEFDVVIRVAIHDGWHAYTDLPPGSPYTPMTVDLDVPNGMKRVGDWQMPKGHFYPADPALTVLGGEFEFRCKVRGDAGKSAKFGCRLSYQVCDERMCLPPRVEELTTTVRPSTSQAPDLEFRALEADYVAAMETYLEKTRAVYASEEFRKARQNNDRAAVRKLMRKHAHPEADFAPRFAALADERSGEQQAQCLLWVVTHTRDAARKEKAAHALLEHHMDSPAVTAMIEGWTSLMSLRGGAHEIFQIVAARSKDSNTVAEAMWVDAYLGRDRGELKSVEKKIQKEFPDSTAALRIAGKRFARNNLQVGMTAPEIEGEDIDGVPFKLSDYRGKVVLLDFWGDW